MAAAGHPQWEEEALNTLKGIRQILAQEKEAVNQFAGLGVGAMSGASGIAYVLLSVGQMLDLPELIEEAHRFLLLLDAEIIEKDTFNDVIGGSAGLILVLLAVYRKVLDPKLLTLASMAADSLCKKVVAIEQGMAWLNNNTPEALLGFSHGTAGCAFVLLKLAEYVPNPQYQKVAAGALAYERSLFSKDKQNWPHFTPIGTKETVGWCHGATGIGLSRLALSKIMRNSSIEEEIQVALATTLREAETHFSCNLCCGSLGHLEFFQEAAKIHPHPVLNVAIEKLVSRTVAHHKRISKNGTDGGFHVPSFMKGAAGVGYTLLRHLHPEKNFPQALLLT